jgi:hypothetical protein
MGFVINASSYIMDQGCQTKQSALALTQAMQRPGQIEQLRCNRQHAPFMLDRAEMPADPVLDGRGGEL